MRAIRYFTCYRKPTFWVKNTLLKKQVVHVREKSCPNDFLIESSIGIKGHILTQLFFTKTKVFIYQLRFVSNLKFKF